LLDERVERLNIFERDEDTTLGENLSDLAELALDGLEEVLVIEFQDFEDIRKSVIIYENAEGEIATLDEAFEGGFAFNHGAVNDFIGEEVDTSHLVLGP